MNKIRYWKKKYNFLCSLYDNCHSEFKRDSDLFKRVYYLIGDIGDYIENLKEGGKFFLGRDF